MKRFVIGLVVTGCALGFGLARAETGDLYCQQGKACVTTTLTVKRSQTLDGGLTVKGDVRADGGLFRYVQVVNRIEGDAVLARDVESDTAAFGSGSDGGTSTSLNVYNHQICRYPFGDGGFFLGDCH